MKKIALIFGFMVLTSQLPLCPCRILPENVVQSFEYGREWTGMLLRAFDSTATASATEPSATLKGQGLAIPGMSELEAPQPPELPVELASFVTTSADSNVDVNVPLNQIGGMLPVVVNVKAPADQKELAARIQKEVACAVHEFRVKMMQLAQKQRELKLRNVEQTRKVLRLRASCPLKTA